MMTVRGLGRKLSADPQIQALVAQNHSWPTMLHTKDNLGVNGCIIAAEEQAHDNP